MKHWSYVDSDGCGLDVTRYPDGGAVISTHPAKNWDGPDALLDPGDVAGLVEFLTGEYDA